MSKYVIILKQVRKHNLRKEKKRKNYLEHLKSLKSLKISSKCYLRFKISYSILRKYFDTL